MKGVMNEMKKRFMILMFAGILVLTGCQLGKDSEPLQNETENINEEVETTKDEEYTYSDKLFDSTRLEGKMAVYFLRGDYATKNAEGIEGVTGEATLLVAPDGATMLIDFNNCMNNGAYIAEVLEKLNIQKLDYVVLTSPHIEHLGGYSIVMHCAEVGQIITNYHDFTENATYNNFIKTATEKNIEVSRICEGDTFTFGSDIEVEVFNPSREYADWKEDVGQRNGALLLKFTYNQSSFLIGGDITSSVEEQLIAKYGARLQSSVVKMNNQGSKDSNSKEWIQALNSKVAVGECNIVENDLIVGRYAIRNEAVLHTAIDGTCLVYTAGDDVYEIQVEQERTSDTYQLLTTDKGYFVVR